MKTPPLILLPLLVMTSVGNRAIADEPNAIPVIPADPSPPLFAAGPVYRSKAVGDDASLLDVCGVGDTCWAVGNRGVILRSGDGGATWETNVLQQDSILRSVCFLTNQIGFIAGETWDPFERQRRGIVLKTRDGGDTWMELDKQTDESSSMAGSLHVSNLPPLQALRFFDLENAIAVSSPSQPSQQSFVYKTVDGGRTWQPLASDDTALQLFTAAFNAPGEGIVAGQGNAFASVTGGKTITLSAPRNGARGIHGSTLSRDGKGWLVGDGGLLLRTESSGVTWQQPPGRLSPKLIDIFDYRTVAAHNDTVCIAGSPGGAILYSDDSGLRWSFRALENSATINRIRFVNQDDVLAVGEFGVIHRSNDGGKSWTTVRNNAYRAAVLVLTDSPDHLCLEMLASTCGDQGFRAVVSQPSVDVSLGKTATTNTLQAHAAIADLAANTFENDWRFSRTQPLQHQVRDELMSSWSRQTDSRVSELLPLRLALTIRKWRPAVVCIDSIREQNEVVNVWLEAMPLARQIASGEDEKGSLLDKVGLPRWSVDRVIVRNPAGTSSPLTFSAADPLQQMGTTAGLIAESARTRLSEATATAMATYSITDDGASVPTPRHLLAGHIAAPGTETRRMLTPPSTTDRQLMERFANLHNNLKAVVARRGTSSETPLSLVANLRTLGAQLPPRLRLEQLQHLATTYESVGNLDGQIAVLKEIVESYPDDPASASAAELLFQFYSSSELRHVRRAAEQRRSQAKIQQTSGTRLPGLTAPVPDMELPDGAFSRQPIVRPGEGTLLWNSQGSDTASVDTQWNSNSQLAYSILSRLAPKRARSAENLLRLAASHVRTDNLSQHRTVLAEASRHDGLFGNLALGEMQALHSTTTTAVPVINLPQSVSKPVLDAVFTDECWQKAIEIHLKDTNESRNADCLIMLAWDDDHIYAAGRVERTEGQSNRMDNTAPRDHDADHKQFDRVTFAFDSDRDHTTAFHFTIDETGQTSERCWTNTHWNPQWYVATDGDDGTWRFEAAIPQAELQSTPLQPSDLWGIQIERILPGAIHQELTTVDDDTNAQSTAGHGLLRFIRRQPTQ